MLLVPIGVVTRTATEPTACAGARAVRRFLLMNVTVVAGTVPNATVAPFTNPVPLSVMTVPPAVEPELGLSMVRVGGCTFGPPYVLFQFQVHAAVTRVFSTGSVDS